MTVALMILVNNPGDWGHIYWPLEHAEWNGCTPTDLVFPFFLFIVGVAVPFAIQAQIKQKLSNPDIIRKSIVRALRLFGLGVFLSLFPKFDLPDVRIPGVLQRIALVYLLCSLIFLYVKPTFQKILFFGILVLYYLLMTQVPVPGAGAANLEAESNLGAWLDRLLLSQAHLYLDKPWDPEGLLSTLPAIATGLSGMWLGQSLLDPTYTDTQRLRRWLVVGVALAAAGWVWDAAGFPINKPLWTSSYVLWTSGLALCLFSLFYWVIDLRKIQGWTLPFVVYGVNAITVFFLSGLLVRMMSQIKVAGKGFHNWLYSEYIAPHFAEPKNASLTGAVLFLVIWFFILWGMYRQKMIVKV
jgi:predicted acyltransferase